MLFVKIKDLKALRHIHFSVVSPYSFSIIYRLSRIEDDIYPELGIRLKLVLISYYKRFLK